MERKEFIKVCGFACLGGSALMTVLDGCGSSNYFAQFTLADNQIILKKSEFVKVEQPKSKDETVKTIQRKYVLLTTEKLKFPICVYKTDEDKYAALWMECTHKGCEVKPHGEYLMCPCHGSEFTNQGILQQGPAEENLKTFQTKTDYENIFIQL